MLERRRVPVVGLALRLAPHGLPADRAEELAADRDEVPEHPVHAIARGGERSQALLVRDVADVLPDDVLAEQELQAQRVGAHDAPPLLRKSLRTIQAIRPPAEPVPPTARSRVVRHAGHMAGLLGVGCRFSSALHSHGVPGSGTSTGNLTHLLAGAGRGARAGT